MKGSIRFCYRKIIDFQSADPWSKAVFDATHMEFYMQAQRLDPDGNHFTFGEMKKAGINIDQLQYLTSTAAVGYIVQLNGHIPDIANAIGKPCLQFSDFKFEIIESHITDKTKHRIAILFFSDFVDWIDTIGNQMLIRYKDKKSDDASQTDLIPLVPFLNISSFGPYTNS